MISDYDAALVASCAGEKLIIDVHFFYELFREGRYMSTSEALAHFVDYVKICGGIVISRPYQPRYVYGGVRDGLYEYFRRTKDNMSVKLRAYIFYHMNSYRDFIFSVYKFKILTKNGRILHKLRRKGAK